MRSFFGLSLAIAIVAAFAVAAVSGGGVRRRDFRNFGSGGGDGSLKPRDYPVLIFRPEA